jgi:hypothetical protein
MFSCDGGVVAFLDREARVPLKKRVYLYKHTNKGERKWFAN